MCTFKIVAVSNWELYQKFHGNRSMEEYAEYLAGLAASGINDAEMLENYMEKNDICQTESFMEKEDEKSVGDFRKMNSCLRPDILIIREKNLPEKMYLKLFTQLWKKCENRRKQGKNCAEIIPHTHLLAAQQTGCNGIHLPFPLLEMYQNARALASGGNPRDRAVYSPAPLSPGIEKIGVSIHSPEEAKKAENMGATYLTAGHIFSTDCKKGLPPRGLTFLKEICDSVTIPVYAIGGIHLRNLSLIWQTNAAGACMMSEYMK